MTIKKELPSKKENFTVEEILEEVSEIYYRQCCWDGPKCANCREFDRLKKKVSKRKE